MKIRLFTDIDSKGFPPKKLVAYGRGVLPGDINSFFNNIEEDINPAEAFGKELLNKGAKMLMTHIALEHDAVVIVDSDVDGWTSAALLINYLYECFPAWVENHLTWWLHEGKQHGLTDHLSNLVGNKYRLVICPDSATNDIDAIAELHAANTEVLILDHHLSDVPMSEYAVTINSQYNYPNPQLSGVGVVYQFCRYLDTLGGNDFADNYLDLVATGLMGDMMDIRSLETKELMFKGFKEENLCNPLIAGLADKAAFALSKADYVPSPDNDLAITPMGAAFFIIPLLNALSRSGTLEEKQLVFESMLQMKAFELILSNKRGHKQGELEKRVEQALRCCTNVKNRQTRAEEAGMELLTSKAETMLDNKVLLFTLEKGEIDPNIAGLVANKLMSKYQRPVCVTRRVVDGYAGSMRGYTATGIDNFKEVAETSKACAWVRGHENAAGISIIDPSAFIADMNETLKDISTDIVHYVDYSWDVNEVDGDTIVDLAEMNDYLATGFARPQVFIDNIDINESNFFEMAKQTLKIKLPNGIDIIKFAGTEEEIDAFRKGCKVKMVCKCNINEWNGIRNPQLICLDYEVIPQTKTVIDSWGF